MANQKNPSLAMAYAISKGNKKKPKYAKGGQIPPSAKSESKPMPDQGDSGNKQAMMSGNKPSKNDSWTDNSTIKQAQKPSIAKLSRPKMVGSDAFSVRSRDMRDDEADMTNRLPPQTDRAQPVKRDDEKGPNRQGDKVPDMNSQHNNKRQPYIKEIEDQYAQDMAAAEMKKVQSYAKGGPVMEPRDHHIELMERDEESDMDDNLSPSEDEGDMDAHSRDEEDADGSNPNRIDMEDEHNNGRRPYASGGSVRSGSPTMNLFDGGEIDDEDQPEPEADDEDHDSLVAAIMAKRKKMADGGQVDIDSNNEEQPNGYYARNEDAALKENYDSDMDDVSDPMDSNEHGDHIVADLHDMVEKIRSKMSRRKSFR